MNIFSIGIIILSALSPIVIGYNSTFSNENKQLDNLAFLWHNENNNTKKYEYFKERILNEYPSGDMVESEEIITPVELHSSSLSIVPMDSPWPMKCHDNHHTGQSPYSTADNPYDEIWRFKCDWIEGGPVIDENGNIYFGDFEDYLYALNPDGTLKWKYKTNEWIWGVPAISEDGTIYIGSQDWSLYAINPNGTLKWKIGTGGSVYSSPAIAEDGTIYVGTESSGNSIIAINSNRTIKWKYKTGDSITSDPAIGNDGTVYCGSQDSYLYALYPNGTLRWRFKTGKMIMGPPSIAEDNTIYIASWDDYLYAIYPNGTMKWKSRIGVGCGNNPSIGSDGTIYVGHDALYAIYSNGTRKWKFDLGSERAMFGSSPAISSDGTIYVGTNIGDAAGGEIIAINPDGTERWRKKLTKKWVDSSPCIGKDGTVYIGTANYSDEGYLYAFNRAELEVDADGPHYGLIDEPVEFSGIATGGYPPYSYHWDFGDTHSSDEQNPLHTYTTQGNYTVTLTVTDDTGNTSDDYTWAWIQDGNSPPNIPDIDGPNKGTAGKTYPYTFTSSDPEGLQVWYYIDWDDGTNTGWKGPYSSGLTKTFNHKWTNEGTYTIKCKAKDPYDDESPFGELTVKIPRDKSITRSPLFRFLERYPLLNLFIQKLIL